MCLFAACVANGSCILQKLLCFNTINAQCQRLPAIFMFSVPGGLGQTTADLSCSSPSLSLPPPPSLPLPLLPLLPSLSSPPSLLPFPVRGYCLPPPLEGLSLAQLVDKRRVHLCYGWRILRGHLPWTVLPLPAGQLGSAYCQELLAAAALTEFGSGCPVPQIESRQESTIIEVKLRFPFAPLLAISEDRPF